MTMILDKRMIPKVIIEIYKSSDRCFHKSVFCTCEGSIFFVNWPTEAVLPWVCNLVPPQEFEEQKLDTWLWIGVENRAGEKKVGHLKPTGGELH